MLEFKSIEIRAMIPKNENHKNIRVTFWSDKTGVFYQYKDIKPNISSSEIQEVLAFEESLIHEPYFRKLGFDIPATLG